MERSKEWKTIALLVCVFVTIREIRPIEPFFTSYLKSMGFTLNQVNEQIYAVGTYSCLVLSIIMFLVTDYLRYKSLIVADGIAGIFTYVLLLEGPSLVRVQFEQVCFGFFYSSEVAFTAYLYAKVDDRQYYQKITSLVKASMLFGRFLSGLIAQTVVSTHFLDKIYLVYFSIISTSFVTIWALFLPKVNHSLYFHRNKEDNTIQHQLNGIIVSDDACNNINKTSKTASITEVTQMILDDFQSAYRNAYVAKKCFWWIFAVVGHILVTTYIQVVWEEVSSGKQDLMNGAVESINTLCGAAGAYVVGHLHYNWKKLDDIVYAVGTLILASLLFIIYYCNVLWILYIVYITFGTLYYVLLTITTSEVAKYIKPDSYGLVFGFNLFMSLLVISIFTLLFIQGFIVVVGTKNQILTMSLMYASMSVMYIFMTIRKRNK